MEKRPDLGDIVEAYCPRCRLNLDASVAAITGGEIRQVQCRTCGNFHEFKSPVPPETLKERGLKRALNMKKKRTFVPSVTVKSGGRIKELPGRNGDAATAPAAPPKPAGSSDEWHKHTDGVPSHKASLYRPQRRYSTGDYLIHKQHGMGYVKEVSSQDGKEWAVVVFRLLNETLPVNRPDED
jgi:hypothetical protein